jgi:hypothetical protein
MNLINSSTRSGEGAAMHKPRTGRDRFVETSAPETAKPVHNSQQKRSFFKIMNTPVSPVATLLDQLWQA